MDKQEYWIKKKKAEWQEISSMGKRFEELNCSGYFYKDRLLRAKITLAVFLICLIHPTHGIADDWTREDSYRQAALTALLVADWGQTRYIAKHPDQCNSKGCLEEEGIARFWIGRHPTTGQVNNYFAASIAVNAAISYVLPPVWRHGWQYLYIGYEANTVGRNRNIGIKMAF
jgi:hypothetical protein